MWSREETDGDGRVDPLDVCLLDEDLSRFEAEVLDLLFGYRLAASSVQLDQQSGVGWPGE